MKTLIILLLSVVSIARAASVSVPTITSSPVVVAGDAVDIRFHMSWWADDYPQNSAPGRLDLMDSGGTLVARIVASDYMNGGVSIQVSGSGSVDAVTSNVGRFSPNGTPADGFLAGTWHATGLAPGSYQLRAWSWETYDSDLVATGVWTDSFVIDVSEPTPPPPPPPPPQTMFMLSVGAGSGGVASGGGSFAAGTAVAITATAEPGFEFAGWSGDAGGLGNPVVLTVDRDLSVQANFAPTALALATNALSGGNVTPGGSYPFGTWVTISAVADAAHYFTGWSGDAGGSSTSVNVLMDRAKSVVGMFAAKTGQSITFAGPGDQPVGATPSLSATTSSGLPVIFSVVSGPATVSGNVLTVTGSGPVTVQAAQPGDAYTLSAPTVSVTLNAIAPAAKVRVQTVARTILRDTRTATAGSYILGNP